MTFREAIRAIQATTGIDDDTVQRVLLAAGRLLHDEMRRGGRLVLQNLGSWRVRMRRHRPVAKWIIPNSLREVIKHELAPTGSATSVVLPPSSSDTPDMGGDVGDA